ncbi:MAG: hypothetical protein QUT30_09370 [Acidobacteriota bacterium]|nr:hypothetical protein [Acidobacteriota bacterium]
MKRHKFIIYVHLIFAAALALATGVNQSYAQSGPNKDKELKFKGDKITGAERKAAAQRAADLGLLPGVAGLDAMTAGQPLSGIEGPGGVPHYFGPYANWAFSPLPKRGIASVTVDNGGSGYTAPTVEIRDVYGTGVATASATVVGGVITDITVEPGSSGFHVPVVVITDATGTGAEATALMDNNITGGIRKFVDKLPGLGPSGANNVLQEHGDGQYIPVAIADKTAYPEIIGPPAKPASDYYEIALVEYSEKLHSDLPPTRLRGYVQLETPGTLAAMTAMGLVSKHVPVGGGKYAVDNPHYLGPIIVAQGRVHGIQGSGPDPGDPRPVRIKFYNLLPTGSGGDLFIPVDRSVPGSGYGPAVGNQYDIYKDNRATIHLHGNNTVWISDGNVHQWITPANENTPYPAGVSARNVPDMDGCASDPSNPLLPGSSGCMTFYYTNAQSARLQFYHDHAHGITRLNVYAGQAAGYLLTDAVDQDMINGTNVTGVNPDGKKVLPDLGIPLIIQDKTFVEADTVFAQDPTWNWGTGPRNELTKNITGAVDGDLWYPHVYMSVQNPWDVTGTNAFGRWHYGPWFNPPTPVCVNGQPTGCIEVGPVPNPYCMPKPPTLANPNDYDCSDAPWEPPFMPGNPNPSIPGESFFDTMLVNGTAYPYVEVEPKAYRFRVLNASNDRFVNLQLYVAADKLSPTTAGTTGAVICDGVMTRPGGGPVPPPSDCTEVAMREVVQGEPNQLADTPSGLPNNNLPIVGPEWWLIGTEGGFLPKPVVVPQQPVGYNLDMAYFAFGIVNQHSLFLGAAERADVVVDFSKYAGKTLILYNDSPAPVPAGAAQYDNYTGNGDLVDGGGAPNTLPGYGPNTRTIMQIRVGTTVTVPTPDVTLANLEAVFAKTDSKRGVFEVSQDPIIIPQAEYNSAYNANFPSDVPSQYFQIADTEKTFQPIDAAGVLQAPVTIPLEMKAMHDEMGGVYDTLYGRMSGMLGVSLQNSAIHVLVPYGLASPPVDLVKGSLESTLVGVMPDGTQIWRIFHNGVDTHPIHTHLFHSQLINRVDQSGQLVDVPVDPIELGWKDTFRINPLEVTYIAMRPTIPMQDQVPFEVPDSIRLIDPTLPEGATLMPPPPAGWFDPAGNAIPEILNHYVNFGWEYVWHCHILSHEEMDFMHALVYVTPPLAPTQNALTQTVQGNNRRVIVSWKDNSIREVGFTIERASDVNFTSGLRTFNVGAAANSGSTVTYTDTTVANNNRYWYRVYANGATVGDTQAYANSIGFPTMSADSVSGTQTILVGAMPGTPNAPTNLTATLQSGPQVSLTWRDNATNETGFAIYRCAGAGCTPSVQIATAGPRNNTGNVTYVDATVAAGNSYTYLVYAVNSAGQSAPSNTASRTVPAVPEAPSSLTLTNTPANGQNSTMKLDWVLAVNPTNFTIQRAQNLDFTTGLSTFTVAGNLRTLTQTVRDNTVYYYRIRANSDGGSSAWTNAKPFPIRTVN